MLERRGYGIKLLKSRERLGVSLGEALFADAEFQQDGLGGSLMSGDVN
jgi:hypothetical protein